LLKDIQVRWWLFRGHQEQKHRRSEAALQYFEKVLCVDPTSAYAALLAGTSLGELKRYDDAMNAFNRALQLAPNYAQAHSHIDHLYMEMGHFREAHNSLQRAFRIDARLKESPYWLYEFGVVSGNSEFWEEALGAFSKLAQLDEKNGNVWHGLGWAYSYLNRETDAINAYQRAVELAPGNSAAHRELGGIYFKLGKYKESCRRVRYLL
jgi:tetratricopeptide (TPR) repeat protein